VPLTRLQGEYLGGCDKRWNIKTGATGSGKTYLDTLITIPKRIMACRGEGLIVLIGNTKGTLERNIIDPMSKIWGEKVVTSIRSDNTAYMFGKKVYCLGADNKKHVDRIRGATIEYCYGDEVTTWDEGVFNMLKSRLRCEHSHFDGTCNPDSPNHWLKKFLDSDADIFQQAYTIDDNNYLPAKFVEQLKAEYAGTVYYDRYILGLWTQAQGLIYPMWADAFKPATATTYEDYCISIDYGTQNAFAAIIWGKNGYLWRGLKIYYYSGRDERHQKTDYDYADDLVEFVKPYPINDGILTIVDPSAASFKAELRHRDIFRVRDAKNDVADGIRETARAIKRGIITFDDSLLPVKKEFQSYVWDEKSNEDKPVKIGDHAMDSIRYFVHTMRVNQEYDKSQEQNGFSMF